MFFASDNSGPVPQAVLDELAAVNTGYAWGYGGDPLTKQVEEQIRTVFEAPDAAVRLAATGTSANSLALATLVQPYQTVFCSRMAHLHEDECNAPEFFTGGAKLTLVGDADKMTPDTLRTAIEAEENRGVHGPQRGAVSITQVTERGNVYSLHELSELCAIARSFDLPVHLDGARFANAMVSLGCSAAEMSWKLGIDVVTFGGTKNGLMGVEAVVFFDPSHAWEFELRRKRGGHLFSKHRYLSAQMSAYLKDDLWIDLATRANEAAQKLAPALQDCDQIEILNGVDANMIFFNAPRSLHRHLINAGAQYNMMVGDPAKDGPLDEVLMGRFVTDWSLKDADIEAFLALLR